MLGAAEAAKAAQILAAEVRSPLVDICRCNSARVATVEALCNNTAVFLTCSMSSLLSKGSAACGGNSHAAALTEAV